MFSDPEPNPHLKLTDPDLDPTLLISIYISKIAEVKIGSY
jgi:hypothetical protein